jgi:hypothetical protein
MGKEGEMHLYGQGRRDSPVSARKRRCTYMGKEEEIQLFQQGREGAPVLARKEDAFIP